MTNEVLTEETRRDRWVRLPYALMLMMVLIGAMSYVLDSRAKATATQSAQIKAEAFIQRRIAEHEQAAKQPAPVVKPVVAQKPAPQLATTLTPSVKPNHASTFSGILSRINLRGKLNYLKSKPKWTIGGASAVVLLGLILFAIRRNRQNTVSFSELLTEKETPVVPEVKIEAPVEETTPCIFSLYSNEETVEEGSFITTYIKPTISSFGESLRSIFARFTRRENEERDPMHTLIPSVITSIKNISASPSIAAHELNSTGNLFRRAVVIRK